MKYEKPFVQDLGPIADHTWSLPPDGMQRKPGLDPITHLDMFCEESGCVSANDPDCVDDPACTTASN